MKFLKRYWKRIVLIALLTPPAAVLLIAILLYLPPIQRRVVNIASEKLSQSMGMKVTIGDIRIGFPLSLNAGDISAVKTDGDTLASVRELRLDIDPLALLNSRLSVSGLGVSGAYLHYTDSLGLTELRARIGDLQTSSIEVNLKKEQADIGRCLLSDADIYFCTVDTMPDTTKKESLRWVFNLKGIDLSRVRADIRMPLDSLFAGGNINTATLNDFRGDLAANRYSIKRVRIRQSGGHYACDTLPSGMPGRLDVKHIRVDSLDMDVRNLISQGRLLELKLVGASLHERSGLRLIGMKAECQTDSCRIAIKGLSLRTNESFIRGNLLLPFSLMEKNAADPVDIDMVATVGIGDVERLADYSVKLPSERNGRITAPELSIKASGTAREINVDRLCIDWLPYLSLQTSGKIIDPTNELLRKGDLAFRMQTGVRAGRLSALANLNNGKFALPAGLRLDGEIQIAGSSCKAGLKMTEGGGSVRFLGQYDILRKSYRADLTVKSLNLEHFMPADSIGTISLALQAHGRGYDPFSRQTTGDITAQLNHIEYGRQVFDSISLNTRLHKGELNTFVETKMPALRSRLEINGLVARNALSASMLLEVDTVNLHSLGFVSDTVALSMKLNGSMESNLKEAHTIDINLIDLHVSKGSEHFAPREILLSARSRPDSISLRAEAGDLKLNVDVAAGLSALGETVKKLTDKANEELKRVNDLGKPTANLREIYALLPRADLSLTMGRNNPLSDYISTQNMSFASFEAYLNTGASEGINGLLDLRRGQVDTTRYDRLVLAIGRGVNTRYFAPDESPIYTPGAKDTLLTYRYGRDSLIREVMGNDAKFLDLMLRINKTKYRNQPAFQLNAAARMTMDGVALRGDFTNATGEKTFVLGAKAYRDALGYGLHIEAPPYPLVVGGESVRVNGDNEIYYYTQDKRLRANLELRDTKGAVLKAHTNDSVPGEEALTLLVQHLALEQLRSIPGMSDIGGLLFADLRLSRRGGAAGQITASGDLSVNDLTYTGENIGNVAMSIFYEPRNKVSHYINGDVSYNGHSALALEGIYNTASKTSPLDLQLQLTEFPLSVANPILGADLMALFGRLNGKLDIKGETTKPDINGTLSFDDAGMKLAQYGMKLYLDTVPLRFTQSDITFEKFGVYTDQNRRHPLTVHGDFALFGKQPMFANLTLKTNNFQVLNNPKPEEGQLLYGKLFMDADLTIRGPVQGLRIRGNLNVLGNTDCTYIYADSPLKPENKMAGVVTFTDFADTLFVKKPPLEESQALGGLDVLISLDIDPAVQMGVDLSPGHADYVQIMGGGNLTFSYPPFGDMNLTGRYDMNGGTARYTIPVVGTKTFVVDPGSYISWSGHVSDPYINFKAMQRVRADVDDGSGTTRKVNFDVGIVVQETLKNLHLAFDLTTPEDLALQTQIKSMSAEERGKQAIGLMATGVYLASAGGGKFNFDAVLNSLVQSELNNLTGKLLEGSDLSIGMEDSESGNNSRDITYSFSKRFFNDRIRVIIGGKVQTGKDPGRTNQTFVDNAAVEYRIDQAGSHYLTLFHHGSNDNIFEGELTETGISYIIRRKLNYVSDLFKFRKTKLPEPPAAPSLSSPGSKPQGSANATPDSIRPQRTKE